MQISKLWVSGCRWKRVFVWLQIFSTLELCITNTCFVCSCQKSVLWEHYEQVSKWEDKSFSLLLLQVRQGIFGRYWRLIMNYAENCLKIKPQSKIKLSNMLKPLEHHRTCLVTVIFVEMFDGLWKVNHYSGFDYALGLKKVISKGGGEWELNLLYVAISYFTSNYATTKLNCSLLLLFISTWLWCVTIAFRGRILKQESFTHEKVNYCAAV